MVTLDRDDILSALDELVGVLVAAEARAHIRIVGGAAIAVFERYYPEELLPARARAQLTARFP